MTLARLVIEARAAKQKVVFFGFSLAAQASIVRNVAEKARCDYYVDNDVKKQGITEVCGIKIPPIFAPTKLFEEDKNTFVAITTTNIFGYNSLLSIYSELAEKGFTNVYADTTIVARTHLEEHSFELMSVETANNLKNTIDTELLNKFNTLNRIGIPLIRDFYEDDYSKNLLEKLLEKYRTVPAFSKSFSDICTPNQYFNDVLEFSDNEVYVDCGTYSNGTVLDFIFHVGNYKHIYGFEPDPRCFLDILKTSIDIPNFTPLNLGLSNRTGIFTLIGENGGVTQVGDPVNNEQPNFSMNQMQITTLDTFFDISSKNLPPTFIKMDIESEEYNALLGAEWVIKTYKPKLAICVYHLDDDLYKIPKLIKEFVPEYKLYLRHHTSYHGETVLYATV